MKTPELDRMRDVHERSQEIGDFLEWLRYDENHVQLAIWDGEKLIPFHYNIEQLLANYFHIDLNKVESERRALLDALREAQNS